MANDRMYLRCDVCHGAIMLGKHLAAGWYNQPTDEQLGEFMDEHVNECGYSRTSDPHAIFRVHYESDEPFHINWDRFYRAAPTPEPTDPK